jgi:hypothetical protein
MAGVRRCCKDRLQSTSPVQRGYCCPCVLHCSSLIDRIRLRKCDRATPAELLSIGSAMEYGRRYVYSYIREYSRWYLKTPGTYESESERNLPGTETHTDRNTVRSIAKLTPQVMVAPDIFWATLSVPGDQIPRPPGSPRPIRRFSAI